jgi:hypothetical protein
MSCGASKIHGLGFCSRPGNAEINRSRTYSRCQEEQSVGRAIGSRRWQQREIEYIIDPRETSELPATVLYGENQGSIPSPKNPENHQRTTQHIDVQYRFTRARVEWSEIAVEYIPTAEMTADILRKSLEWVKHERYMRGMGLVDQRSGN